LLRLVAGLEEPSAGAVELNGRGIDPTSVAMVFQTLALFPHLTAGENISLGLRIRKVAKEEVKKRIREVAELLVIEGLLDRKPNQLSAGERQRVALARALVKRPSVLLLDEPFANLDWQLRTQLRSELKRLHAQLSMTMICVTHDLLEAVSLGQRIAVLNCGKVEQFDTPDRLLDQPANAFVKSFLAFPEVPEIMQHLRDAFPETIHDHVAN